MRIAVLLLLATACYGYDAPSLPGGKGDGKEGGKGDKSGHTGKKGDKPDENGGGSHEKGCKAEDKWASCTIDKDMKGHCKPLSQCPHLMSSLQTLCKVTCELKGGGSGVCCPKNKKQETTCEISFPTYEKYTGDTDFSANTITDENFFDQKTKVEEGMKKIKEIEQKLIDANLIVQANTPENTHQNVMRTYDEALVLGQKGAFLNSAFSNLIKTLGLTREKFLWGMGDCDLTKPTTLDCQLPPKIECNAEAEYRTADGSCNNLENPSWGTPFTPFLRLLRAFYQDHMSTPRLSKDDCPLPNPRVISTTVLPDLNVPDNEHSLAAMQFGQFLDHDLTLTPVYRGINNTGIVCCNEKILADPTLRHPECMEIEIPKNDPFYNTTCMEFVRSLETSMADCKPGPRQQINQLTAFIDASQVYGPTKNISDGLREFKGGRLRTSECDGKPFLPFASKDMKCGQPNVAFVAGDTRVTEVPQLTTCHTIFMRDHNRIAKELAECNKDWAEDDEKLYQETRKIIGAKWQHIVYNEFLPIILGPTIMDKFNLTLEQCGYIEKYDSSINPSIHNEFTAAAYRFGHSMVTSLIKQMNSKYEDEKSTQLRNAFGQGGILLTSPFVEFVRGLATQKCQTRDQWMSQEVTNHLYQVAGQNSGMDLAAINIQRGRDHGLPPYTHYRALCGLPKVEIIEELDEYLLEGVAKNLSKVYKHVDDLDLWPVGISEKPLPGAVVGPTFACIIGYQFHNLKYGDRFWYENGGEHEFFTSEQLQELRKVSLASMFCDNVDDLEEAQPLILINPSECNKRVSCKDTKSIPRMDLSPWCKK